MITALRNAGRLAWRDTKRGTFVFMAAVTALSSYHAVRLRFGDPSDYVTPGRTEGPFSVVKAADGTFAPGPRASTYRPGEMVGWTQRLCPTEGVGYDAHIQFVRLAQNGVPETESVSKTHHFRPGERECGPLFGTLRVPPDALPGVYEMRRWVGLREGSLWPLRIKLEILRVQVLPDPDPQGPAIWRDEDRGLLWREADARLP